MQKSALVHSLTLFTSFSTLMCCALPALLVSLGAGAALASVISAVPQLAWLTEHKIILFTVAGVMLLASGILRYHNRHAPCPADPLKAASCARLRAFNRRIFIVSAMLYAIGFFFAFLAPSLL